MINKRNKPVRGHRHPIQSPLLLVLLLLTTSLSSCKHRVFERPAPHTLLKVVFDWQHAPSATPEQMSIYFFPIDDEGRSTGTPHRYDMAGREGGTIQIGAGKYHVIALNSDVRGTYMKGDTYEMFHITTNENPNLMVSFSTTRTLKVPRATGTEEEKVVEVPDVIYSARKEAVEIEIKLNGNPTQELVLAPKKTTSTIEIEILEVKHHQHVVSYGGSLTGLSSSILLSGPTPSETRVTVPFGATASGQGMKAKMETFGASRTMASPQHKLVIYAQMASEQAFYEEFDVLQAIQQAPDPFHIKITIPLLSLPEPTFLNNPQVQVEQWEKVDVSIDM